MTIDIDIPFALIDPGPQPEQMTPSPACLNLIRQFEGCKLNAYRCPAGVLTIGYGHTGGVAEGSSITPTQADALLKQDADVAAAAVRKLAGSCTQNQFDALTDFVFNLGAGALRSSTLLRYHNAGDYAEAAAEFGKWVHANGEVLPGLVKRRAAEAHLYLTHDTDDGA